MRNLLFASAATLSLAIAGPAFAQSTDTMTRPGHEPGVGLSEPASTRASNIDRADTRSDIAPQLPVPPIGVNADPDAYLRVAQRALEQHRTGEAQEALERAETRMLDRTTAPQALDRPDRAPAVEDVTAAREALGHGDTATASQDITQAMSSDQGMSMSTSSAASAPTAAVAPTGPAASAVTAANAPVPASEEVDGIPGATYGAHTVVSPDNSLVTYQGWVPDEPSDYHGADTSQ